MTDVTDRAGIAESLLGRLAELDQLRAVFEEKQSAVDAAQAQADQAADAYSDKITDLLSTGWATPPALAAQGHAAPKRRIGGRRKGAATEAHAAPEHDDQS